MLRGFGILLMVMGHVGFGSASGHWIHAFHMPLFFIVSGFLFKPGRPLLGRGGVARKKTVALLVPFAFFSVFHLLLAMPGAFATGEG